MNKQYRVVFNHQRNAFVVVSEQAKTQGKAQVSNVGKTTMQAVLSAATILTASLSTTPVLADNWTVTGDKAYNNTNNTTLSFWDFDNEDHACEEMSHCYLSFRPGKAPKYEGVAGFYDAQGATEAVQIITGTHPNTPNWYQKEGNATQLYNMKKSFDLIRETNKLREENGLTPFKVSHKLMAIAQLHHKNWYSEEETFDDEQRHSLSSGYVAPYAQQHIQHWYEKGKKGFWEETNDGFTPYQKCEVSNRHYCAFMSGLKGIPDEYAHLTATGAGYLPDTGVDTNHSPYWITTYANSANDAISFEEYEKLFDAYYATNGQTFYNENQTVTAYDVELTRLFGGYATEGKNATGNTVNLSGKSSSPNNSYGADIYGGYAVKGNANGNTVNVSDNAVANSIYAGVTVDGDANNNVVNVYGGEISEIIAGATINSGNATHNTVNIYAGDITHITGGYSHYETGIKTHNVVNIYGGKVGNVAAGSAGEVRDSAVNYFDGQVKYEIRGAKTGYDIPPMTFINGNQDDYKIPNHIHNTVLNLGSDKQRIKMNTLSAGSVGDFTAYNFYLPSNVKKDDTALSLTGHCLGCTTWGDNPDLDNSDLGNADVNVYLTGDTHLNKGDEIHLFHVTDDRVYLSWNGKGSVYQGITLKNDLGNIALDKERHNLNLTWSNDNTASSDNGSDNSNGGNTGTNNGSVSDNANNGNTNNGNTNNGNANNGNANNGNANNGNANNGNTNNGNTNNGNANNGNANNGNANNSGSGTTVNPQTTSLLTEQLVGIAMINQVSEDFSGSLNALYTATNTQANQSGGSAFANAFAGDQRITTGSHIDIAGGSVKAGYAHNFKHDTGATLAGLYAEYGKASYDSHLDDGTTGSGNTQHYGVGAFVNHSFDKGLYLQGSLKAGQVKSDYESDDFVHASGHKVTYETDATYLGTHIGVGQVVHINDNNSVDIYGKFFHTRTSSNEAQLSSGETYQFDAVKSNRLRVGMRYDNTVNNNVAFFAGAAFEREFDATSNAHYQGFNLPSPTMKGNTGIGEIGVAVKAGSAKVDASVQGFAGRRKGGSLNIGIRF